ncbi:MAG: ectonucleotide pyrophosphatase/phosphodiesterase [Polyangiaceae bacterium]
MLVRPERRSSSALALLGFAFFGLLGCAAAPSPVVAPVAAAAQPPGPVRHVIVITLDGLKPESYTAPDAHGLRIPVLRRLVAEGAWSDGARSVFPSVTYPAHTTIATGVLPGRHGIVSNRAFDPLEKNQEGWRWYAEEVKVPRIWDLAANASYSSALINWPVTVGDHATYLVPEFWRARTADDLKLVRALSTPGLLDAVGKAYPGFDKRFTEEGINDEGKTDIAAYLIAKSSPNVLFLHLTDIDGAQHKYGLWSAEALTQIENTDRQLGRLLEATQRSGNSASTAFIIASDHGFANVSRLVRPGALLRQAGLVQLDDKGKVSAWSASVLPNGGSSYVYLKDPEDKALQAATLKVFEDKLHEPNSGLGRVLQHAEITALGGDPEAFLALDAAPNTTIGAGYSGDYDAPITVKAMHGYDPNRPEMKASLLLFGANVSKGKLNDARLVDIAPTIAAWLQLPLSSAKGKPLQASGQSAPGVAPGAQP